ncbi:MAG: carbamate kinase [Chloroflexi bacterium]|nr:carbamate kinase [Chloroflexota bacterium]
MTRLAVVAVGGNSLSISSDGNPDHASVDAQFATSRLTASQIVELVAGGWQVVLTHGNGPQVGHALLRAEVAASVAPELPLATVVAQTQGEIGFMLQNTLANEISRRGLTLPVASVITQVVVDPGDPHLDRSTKPVGPFYSAKRAAEMRRRHGWLMVEDAGRGWRRVVPSPSPVAIVELPAIQALLKSACLVIAAGGGGTPVIRQEDGTLTPLDAVIDKDRVSALLAVTLDADLLIISTGVDQVALDFGTPHQRCLGELTVRQARDYLAAGQFPPGSMGPKIEGAVQFAEQTGRAALITSPECLADALRGAAGTWIVPDQRAHNIPIVAMPRAG